MASRGFRAGIVTVAVILTGTGLTAAAASPGTSGHGLLYALLRPVCAKPATPTEFRCFAIRRVLVRAGTPGATAVTAVGQGPSGGYTPAQLAKAYRYDPSVNRSTFTVGIVDWFDDPKVRTDLNTFDHHYGLHRETSVSFRKVNENGAAAPLPAHQGGASSPEIALDVQAVRGVCHTCRILLVEAANPTNRDIAKAENTAVRLGAQVVTNSFGGPERPTGSTLHKAFNHPGVVITASTGDDGWGDFDLPKGARGTPASFPSTDPHVVAVGGTDLVLNGNGSIASEQIWNENPPASSAQFAGAAGGGCSNRYRAADWQSHNLGYRNAGCHGKRLAADISALADPMHGYDIQDTDQDGVGRKVHGWLTIGGTSLSSPVIAAMFALKGGSGGAAYPASTLYTNRTHRRGSLFDVHHGGNSYCGGLATATCSNRASGLLGLQSDNPNGSGRGPVDCSFPRGGQDVSSAPPRSRECNAARGYDGPSGVGAPRGLGAFRPTNPTATISRPQHAQAGSRVAFTAHVHKRLPHTSVRFLWTWGDGSSSHDRAPSIHHRYPHAGQYHVKLQLRDNRFQLTIERTTITIT
jgi:hypothetical protein